MATPKPEGPKGTVRNGNLFDTLKYAVEAVPFFDGQNIPLTYFVEGCEEARCMPAEAESQFTKIIRTRIVGKAHRNKDRNFNNELTQYLKSMGLLKMYISCKGN